MFVCGCEHLPHCAGSACWWIILVCVGMSPIFEMFVCCFSCIDLLNIAHSPSTCVQSGSAVCFDGCNVCTPVEMVCARVCMRSVPVQDVVFRQMNLFASIFSRVIYSLHVCILYIYIYVYIVKMMF